AIGDGVLVVIRKEQRRSVELARGANRMIEPVRQPVDRLADEPRAVRFEPSPTVRYRQPAPPGEVAKRRRAMAREIAARQVGRRTCVRSSSPRLNAHSSASRLVFLTRRLSAQSAAG